MRCVRCLHEHVNEVVDGARWKCSRCGCCQRLRTPVDKAITGESGKDMYERSAKNPKAKHYELWDDFQVIDAIKTLLTPEEYQGFLKGNMLKYRLRAGKKDDTLADIEKALDYEREIKGE